MATSHLWNSFFPNPLQLTSSSYTYDQDDERRLSMVLQDQDCIVDFPEVTGPNLEEFGMQVENGATKLFQNIEDYNNMLYEEDSRGDNPIKTVVNGVVGAFETVSDLIYERPKPPSPVRQRRVNPSDPLMKKLPKKTKKIIPKPRPTDSSSSESNESRDDRDDHKRHTRLDRRGPSDRMKDRERRESSNPRGGRDESSIRGRREGDVRRGGSESANPQSLYASSRRRHKTRGISRLTLQKSRMEFQESRDDHTAGGIWQGKYKEDPPLERKHNQIIHNRINPQKLELEDSLQCLVYQDNLEAVNAARLESAYQKMVELEAGDEVHQNDNKVLNPELLNKSVERVISREHRYDKRNLEPKFQYDMPQENTESAMEHAMIPTREIRPGPQNLTYLEPRVAPEYDYTSSEPIEVLSRPTPLQIEKPKRPLHASKKLPCRSESSSIPNLGARFDGILEPERWHEDTLHVDDTPENQKHGDTILSELVASRNLRKILDSLPSAAAIRESFLRQYSEAQTERAPSDNDIAVPVAAEGRDSPIHNPEIEVTHEESRRETQESLLSLRCRVRGLRSKYDRREESEILQIPLEVTTKKKGKNLKRSTKGSARPPTGKSRRKVHRRSRQESEESALIIALGLNTATSHGEDECDLPVQAEGLDDLDVVALVENNDDHQSQSGEKQEVDVYGYEKQAFDTTAISAVTRDKIHEPKDELPVIEPTPNAAHTTDTGGNKSNPGRTEKQRDMRARRRAKAKALSAQMEKERARTISSKRFQPDYKRQDVTAPRRRIERRDEYQKAKCPEKQPEGMRCVEKKLDQHCHDMVDESNINKPLCMDTRNLLSSEDAVFDSAIRTETPLSQIECANDRDDFLSDDQASTGYSHLSQQLSREADERFNDMVTQLRGAPDPPACIRGANISSGTYKAVHASNRKPGLSRKDGYKSALRLASPDVGRNASARTNRRHQNVDGLESLQREEEADVHISPARKYKLSETNKLLPCSSRLKRLPKTSNSRVSALVSPRHHGSAHSISATEVAVCTETSLEESSLRSDRDYTPLPEIVIMK